MVRQVRQIQVGTATSEKHSRRIRKLSAPAVVYEK